MATHAAQADLLEAIPFVRDITPLDLLQLPQGLFEALPKPCNLKRSAASGGPIWPPVLTNVLINGLLILHHKPHLVGKQGLDEHYNWLSAFIYRQTRGWDPKALARNTIEIKRTNPGERVFGIIRNRKQISSKVQTIGAYVTQGPKPSKDLLSQVPGMGLRTNDITNIDAPHHHHQQQYTTTTTTRPSTANSHPSLIVAHPHKQSALPLDLSHISLEPAWLPPTPFSLPSTPTNPSSAFLYPADIPDFEFVDARVLGYNPEDWPEYESRWLHGPNVPPSCTTANNNNTSLLQRRQRRASFSLGPDAFALAATLPKRTVLKLASASVAVQFGGGSIPPKKKAGGVSPSLFNTQHQLARLDQRSAGIDNTTLVAVSSIELDAASQELIKPFAAGTRIYHVDLPVHVPSAPSDRAYLAQGVGYEFHIKARVELQLGEGIFTDEELKSVSDVYYNSALVNAPSPQLQLMNGYHETVPLRLANRHEIDGNGTLSPSSLVADGLAISFMTNLWTNMTKNPEATDTDLTRYVIVQTILPRSAAARSQDPLLVVVYSPRVCHTSEEASARMVILSDSARSNSGSPVQHHTDGIASYDLSDTEMNATPRPSMSASLSLSPVFDRVSSISPVITKKARESSFDQKGKGRRNSTLRESITSSPSIVAGTTVANPAVNVSTGTVGPIRRESKQHAASYSPFPTASGMMARRHTHGAAVGTPKGALGFPVTSKVAPTTTTPPQVASALEQTSADILA
ncbi:11260_t:CDS:2, partial [Acaulospora colombiana]